MTEQERDRPSAGSRSNARAFRGGRGDGRDGADEAQVVGPSNAALRDLLDPFGIQPKLAVGAVDDVHEREADRFAEQIEREPSSIPDLVTSRAPPPLQRAAVPEIAAPDIEELKRKEAEALAASEAELETEDASEVAQEELETDAQEKEEDESTLLTKRDHPGVPSVPGSFEDSLARTHGGGAPLTADQRAFFEPRLGRDLSRVRVHTGSRAATLNRDLGARAFTRGSDVYFGAGRYSPGTPEGRRLLAHELAHTVQQDPGAAVGQRGATAPAPQQPVSRPNTPLVQREADDDSVKDESQPGEGGVDATQLDKQTGRLDTTTSTITFDAVAVPSFKVEDHRKAAFDSRSVLRQPKAYKRGSPNQRDVWKEKLSADTKAIQDDLTAKAKNDQHLSALDPAQPLYFKAPSKYSKSEKTRYFIGTVGEIATELVLPSWDAGQVGHSYDVDHIVELQLANWSEDPWANTVANMELLDSSKNRSSGSNVKNSISSKVQGFIGATGGQYGESVSAVKQNYNLEFENAVAGETVKVEKGVDYWTPDQIKTGAHLEAVVPANPAELGEDGRVRVFPSESGGVPKSFTWPSDTPEDRNWLKPYVITSLAFDTQSVENESLGTISFNIPVGNKKWEPFPDDAVIDVKRFAGATSAGFIDRSAVRSQLRNLRIKKASPIELDDFEIGEQGIELTGRILPEIELLEGLQIEFGMIGDALEVSAELVAEDLKVPPPFRVDSAALRLTASTETGLTAEGTLEFAIDRMGRGSLVAQASTTSAVDLTGKFEFDTKLFEEAEVDIAYREGVLSLGGRITIGEGTVPGIESATLEVAYDGETETFQAEGTVVPEIQGVEEGGLRFAYSPDEGMTIGGSLALAGDLPAIKQGSIDVTVQEIPEEERWAVTATGEATADVAGADVGLTVSYDDGALTVEGAGAYERGMVKGEVTVGATNRALDQNGEPTGEPTDAVVAYGGGEMTIVLAPWLQGTIGLELLPNGEIEVSGGVSLPSTLDLFPEWKDKRNLVDIGFDVPLVGVAVAGQRIGVFATVSTGLDLEASFGPGQLREAAITVTYNPDREEETTLEGGAELYIPSFAGLRLYVSGGIGVGIPVVSATAELTVGGQLGFQAAARADVDVSWSPAAGLSIDAEGEISGEPVFKLDVVGTVLVEADLIVSSIELYRKDWQIGEMEFGSNLAIGARLPIHYQEGEPFDISWDDIEFTYPEINTEQLLGELIASLP
ncbi:MAG: DUF4157 domain-containing protein [Planctomycetota bacterium]